MGDNLGASKSVAALAAGAITTIVVTVLADGLHYQVAPELSGAIQTLITLIAVYVVPHNAMGDPK